MTNTTCTELYNDMIENTYDLLCDICEMCIRDSCFSS